MNFFRYVVVASVSVVAVSLNLSSPALAEALDDSGGLTYFTEYVQKCDALLNQWETAWKIAVGLAVFVVILGAVSAVLQGFQSRGVKATTVICGLLITIITGVTNTVGWDHRELNRSKNRGQIMTAEMHRLRALYVSAKGDENKRKILEDFGKLVAEFFQMEEPREAVAQADSFGVSIINTAHAGKDEGVPSWVRAVPEDPANLYFVGIADSAKLETAKAMSKKNAIQNAAAFLAGTLNATGGELDIENLTLYLAQASDDAGSYVNYDEKAEIYRYYSLIIINKTVAEVQLKLFAVQHNVKAPAGLVKALGDSQRARDDYATGQLQKYEALLNETRATLNAEEYRKYSEARDLRKQKRDYEQAIPMLTDVLDAKPDFYLGWYNLALAYAALGNEAAARKAYDKTMELEPAQPVRDATVYNAYGHFLLERDEYCQAIAQLEKAISLDQSNPRAQNNLQQARTKLQQSGKVCH